MQHKGTVRLETDRLILRRFRLDDSGAAFQNWTSDKRVTEFLRWPAHDTVNTTKKIIQMWVDGYARDDFYQWAIVLKNNGNGPVGTISVVDRNDALNILHIGYCIGSRWWNQGITSEAFSGIIPFLFEQVKANRIESQHDPRNPFRQGHDKMRLKYEGTLRQADISNKGVVDAAVYSILADEYFSNKRNAKSVGRYRTILSVESHQQIL
ncbi:GNAT family N-acetyltransferase [Ruthenibacterium lactatiformans]|uniref:GNAT family N-acetyltransferase n=1 Tax=Ruthenibacterium lactatiformans TaxID=1550024 RepID=UPI0039A12572